MREGVLTGGTEGVEVKGAVFLHGPAQSKETVAPAVGVHAAADDGRNFIIKDPGNYVVLILEVVIEGIPVDVAAAGDIADGNGGKGLIGHQVLHADSDRLLGDIRVSHRETAFPGSCPQGVNREYHTMIWQNVQVHRRRELGGRCCQRSFLHQSRRKREKDFFQIWRFPQYPQSFPQPLAEKSVWAKCRKKERQG